jgi:predicted TPR repeat methyltransferase
MKTKAARHAPQRQPAHPLTQAPGVDGDAVALLERAIYHLRDDQPQHAEPLLLQVLARWPGHVDALHFLGVLRHQQDRSAEGVALIQQALQLAPQDVGAWNNLGNVLLKQGKVAQATAAYERAIAASSDGQGTASAHSNLATIYRIQDHLDASVSACQRALHLEPDFPDAWYNLSVSLMHQGKIHEGLIANSRAVLLWPQNLQGRQQIIRALLLLGERDRAAVLYREWLAEEPDNVVVQHQLAACLGEAAPERASDDYVKVVFDAFSSSFDVKLEALHYRAPELVTQALAAALGPAPADGQARLDIADAGCGTGLCGPLLRPWAKHLAGCDLSEGMLRRALPRRCYDVLHQAELMFYLNTQPQKFDVVVSADTLCYFGDLTQATQAAHRALRPGGWLIYTVEALDSAATDGHRLQVNGRYAHSRDHITVTLEAAGFTLSALSSETLRMEAGKPVRGWLVTAQRAATRTRGDTP